MGSGASGVAWAEGKTRCTWRSSTTGPDPVWPFLPVGGVPGELPQLCSSLKGPQRQVFLPWAPHVQRKLTRPSLAREFGQLKGQTTFSPASRPGSGPEAPPMPRPRPPSRVCFASSVPPPHPSLSWLQQPQLFSLHRNRHNTEPSTRASVVDGGAARPWSSSELARWLPPLPG